MTPMTSFPRTMLSSHPSCGQSDRARVICTIANSCLSRLSHSHVLWLGIVWTYESVWWALDDHPCVDDRAVYCCIRLQITAVRCFDATYCTAVGDGGRSTLLGFCWLVILLEECTVWHGRCVILLAGLVYGAWTCGVWTEECSCVCVLKWTVGGTSRVIYIHET
jgi:hypothetical protein